LIQTLIFFLLVADVGLDGFLISSHCVDEESSGPKMLPHKVALALSIDPRQMDALLPLMNPTTCDTAYLDFRTRPSVDFLSWRGCSRWNFVGGPPNTSNFDCLPGRTGGSPDYVSMDGKDSWRDNVFVEQLWRSIKYEAVYLEAYETVTEGSCPDRPLH